MARRVDDFGNINRGQPYLKKLHTIMTLSDIIYLIGLLDYINYRN